MLSNVQSNLTKTQEQLSTGKQIVSPSDAPDKAALVTRLDSTLARQQSYLDNLKSVNIRLTAEETALQNTSDVMYRINPKVKVVMGLMHISNGGYKEPNSGLEAFRFTVGYDN